MNAHTKPTTLGKTSPAEKRAEAKQYDFTCECGEEWDAPKHAWWVGRMRCMCGEVVEAK